MGLPRPLIWMLGLLLLGNLLLFWLTQQSADAVAQAQLQQAISAAVDGRDEPPAAKRVVEKAPAVAVKSRSARGVVAQSKQPPSICRLFGPYPRALTAAEVLNRLQSGGASGDLLTTEELEKLQLLPLGRVLPAAQFWVKASQSSLLQGAKPEELASAVICD